MAALNNPTFNPDSILLATRFVQFSIDFRTVQTPLTKDDLDNIETMAATQTVHQVIVEMEQFSYDDLQELFIQEGDTEKNLAKLRQARIYPRVYLSMMRRANATLVSIRRIHAGHPLGYVVFVKVQSV